MILIWICYFVFDRSHFDGGVNRYATMVQSWLRPPRVPAQAQKCSVQIPRLQASETLSRLRAIRRN